MQGNQARAIKGNIGEFELFAQGVPQRVVYVTRMADLGSIANFGRLHWAATSMRMVDGIAVEDPDALVSVKVEVRTGRDEVPDIYHEFTNTGLEKEVTRARYENELKARLVRVSASSGSFRTREPKPGVRASIAYDSDNWTFWSTAISESGKPLELRNGRYIQLLITLQSRTFSDFVRLDSLWIEQAPLLAQQVVGEVARLDEKQPARGFTQVALGEMTDFVYDISARFESETGFDAIRVRTGARTLFKSLKIGAAIDGEDPPESVSFTQVPPEQVVEETSGLLIHLPEPITGQRNRPIRLVFAAEVFDLATTFQGEVIDRSRAGLPQFIVDGDVTKELSTNSLRVLGTSGAAPDLLQNLTLSASAFTPNGDGVNDELQIRYGLFHLPDAVPVVLEVYSLDGRKVAAVDTGAQRSGAQSVRWDGRDQDGQLLSPGIYLLSIAVASESAGSKKIQPIGIVY